MLVSASQAASSHAARRGACPALDAPMRTGDGLLARLSVEGGYTPAQFVALAHAAQRHGNGLLDVSARGNLQIRGLSEASAPMLAREVAGLAIIARTGLPVDLSPLAGRDPAERADPRPVAAAVRALSDQLASADRSEFAQDKESWSILPSNLMSKRSRAGVAPDNTSGSAAPLIPLATLVPLGPKVSVVVDGGGSRWLDAMSADVRLLAMGNRRWQVALAGDARSAKPLGSCAEEEAAALALALLQCIARRGPSARARDLAISGMGCGLRVDGFLPAEVFTRFQPASPLPPEGGVELPRSPPGIGPQAIARDGSQNESGAWALGLPFGQASAGMMAALAGKAEALGLAELRTAPGRLIMGFGPRPALARWADAASEIGFLADEADPRRRIAACSGTRGCASAHIDSRAIAAELAAALPPQMLAPPDAAQREVVHVSGCPKGCAHPAAAPLTIVGARLADAGAPQPPSAAARMNGAPVCGVVIGGSARDVPAIFSPPHTLADLLKRHLPATELAALLPLR